MTFYDLNILNIFYVTGRKSFEFSGAIQYILDNISNGKILNRFSDFSANPNLMMLKKGLSFLKKVIIIA